MGAVKTAAKAQLGLKHSRPAGGNPGRFVFGVMWTVSTAGVGTFAYSFSEISEGLC